MKKFFRPIHLQALVALVIYNILSKWFFFKFVLSQNLFISLIGPYIYGVIAGVLMLYLFSHEDFFPWAREIEKNEDEKEKKWLHKFIHHGKILATFIIGTIGGPIFTALTLRILFHKKPFLFKFLLLAIINLPATILSVSLAKGIIRIF